MKSGNILKNTILFFVSMVFFVACSKNFKTVTAYEYKGKFPDESVKNIEITFSEGGKISFIISAPVLNKYMGETTYMDCPEGVTITSFDYDGTIQSIMTADYGISVDNTQKMEAHRNVVITNLKKGERIETEKIIWDQREKTIYSDVEVRQYKDDGSIHIGDGFDADERFSKYSIRRPRGNVVANE